MTSTANQFFTVKRGQADPGGRIPFFPASRCATARPAHFRHALDVGGSTGLTTIELAVETAPVTLGI